ncbi:MAG TPA: hypothetical protein PKY24_11365 [Opitutaceae bacterium]|nr:hypothetical protein [Opitutaceae bacterium]
MEQTGAHVRRQEGRELTLDDGCRERRTLTGKQERFERIVPADLAHAHHGLRDAGATAQRRLDLAQLDPEATDLHLVVVAPEVFDISVRQPAAEIARPVHAVAGDERVRQEALGRELPAVHVAASHLHAADVDLAGDADRHFAQSLIEHVDLRVAHGPPDWDDLARSLSARVPSHVDGGLRRAVEVV